MYVHCPFSIVYLTVRRHSTKQVCQHHHFGVVTSKTLGLLLSAVLVGQFWTRLCGEQVSLNNSSEIEKVI